MKGCDTVPKILLSLTDGSPIPGDGLKFSIPKDYPVTQSQAFRIEPEPGPARDLVWKVTFGIQGISFVPCQGTGTAVINIIADARGLLPGHNVDDIIIQALDSPNSPQTIPLTFDITETEPEPFEPCNAEEEFFPICQLEKWHKGRHKRTFEGSYIEWD